MWDLFLNQLPMHCNWFVAILIIGICATICTWVWTLNGCQTSAWVGEPKQQVTTTYPFRTFVRGAVSVVVTLATLAALVWLGYSANMSLEVAGEERLEIKSVTFPNGQVKQMFHYHGSNYNVNFMYSCAPPEGSYIKRVYYQTNYAGVYWPCNRANRKTSGDDVFVLVTPDKLEQKPDTVTIAN